MIELLQETLHYINEQNVMLNTFKMIIDEKEEKYKLMYSKICSLLLEEMEKMEAVGRLEKQEEEDPTEDKILEEMEKTEAVVKLKRDEEDPTEDKILELKNTDAVVKLERHEEDPAEDNIWVKQEVCEEDEQNYPNSESILSNETNSVATVDHIKLEKEEEEPIIIDDSDVTSDDSVVSVDSHKDENTTFTVPIVPQSNAGTTQDDSTFTFPVCQHKKQQQKKIKPRKLQVKINAGCKSRRLQEFKCRYCKKLFSKKHTVREHVKLVHTTRLPRQYLHHCLFCNMSFKTRAMLATHTLTHTGEKPHNCEFCGMAFRQTSHLNNHRRIHTGEKPFKCTICPRTFRQKSSLDTHHRSIHYL